MTILIASEDGEHWGLTPLRCWARKIVQLLRETGWRLLTEPHVAAAAHDSAVRIPRYLLKRSGNLRPHETLHANVTAARVMTAQTGRRQDAPAGGR